MHFSAPYHHGYTHLLPRLCSDGWTKDVIKTNRDQWMNMNNIPTYTNTFTFTAASNATQIMLSLECCHSPPHQWWQMHLDCKIRLTHNLLLWPWLLSIQPPSQNRSSTIASTHLMGENLSPHFTQVLMTRSAAIGQPVDVQHLHSSVCHGLSCFSFCPCHYGGWPGATRNWWREILLLKRKWKKRKIGRDSATAIFVRGWLQLIGCSSSSSAQKWWMWTVETDTSTKDEWSVIFSAVSSVKSWTLHHILLFYEAHCSCTHIFSASIIWSGNTLMSLVIKKKKKKHSRHLGLHPSLQREPPLI